MSKFTRQIDNFFVVAEQSKRIDNIKPKLEIYLKSFGAFKGLLNNVGIITKSDWKLLTRIGSNLKGLYIEPDRAYGYGSAHVPKIIWKSVDYIKQNPETLISSIKYNRKWNQEASEPEVNYEYIFCCVVCAFLFVKNPKTRGLQVRRKNLFGIGKEEIIDYFNSLT